MRSALLIVLSLFLANAALAQTAAFGEVTASSDADQFHSTRLRAGAFLNYRSPFEYMGVAAQGTHYSQSGFDRDAPAILLMWRRQERATLAGTIGEAGVVRVAGRTRIIGDATWSYRPEARTGFEILAAADLVETQRALDRGVTYTFVAADFERQLSQRFTVIGLAGYQRFTDGNERTHARARLIFSLVPQHGINAQIRWRHFESSQLDVDRAYFNPGRYSQWDVGMFMRKRYAGWTYFATIAAGRESVDENRTTGDIELRAEGPLPHDMRLVVRAAYNRSAGFAISDRYWYRIASATIVVPIR